MNKIKETRNYPAVIFKDKGSDYGVSFPDFLGCVTAGDTVEEAYEMAKEALDFHIDCMMKDKENIPDPSPLHTIKTNPEYTDAYDILLVPVSIYAQSVRIDITIRKHVLNKADSLCRNRQISRSRYIENLILSDSKNSKAALEYSEKNA